MENSKFTRTGGSSGSLRTAKGRLKPEERDVNASKPQIPPSAAPVARPEVAGMVPPMDRPVMPPQQTPVPPMTAGNAPTTMYMGPPQVASPLHRTQPSRSPAGEGIIENVMHQPRKF
ncbi:hypothetical protein [Ruegeria arenilitoris]|uniref:hypothetical protein n=1 Tax=Ruegeria arenilitoris TaxID=1173585 RepID=UPI00147C2DB6|nr:hypothetical protein [Ruegeria arenilitoris]